MNYVSENVNILTPERALTQNYMANSKQIVCLQVADVYYVSFQIIIVFVICE